MCTYRANPGSEFVVANTLAKRKKLEPNEIDFSQDFSQKVVSRSCSVLTLCSLATTFVVCWYPLQTVWTQIRLDKMSGLIWIQTIWHADDIEKKQTASKELNMAWVWRNNKSNILKIQKLIKKHFFTDV